MVGVTPLRPDFITVDRHLWASFEQMHKHMNPPTEYCKHIMRRARKSQERETKREKYQRKERRQRP